MDDEVPLAGGFSTVVTRSGDTVRRTASPWTPTVQELLRHLHRVGFHQVPNPLGIDEHGREVLAFIEGTTAWWPWPQTLRTDVGLRAVAALVTDLSGALSAFRAAPDAVWHGGPSHHGQWAEGSAGADRSDWVVRHGDLGPWNTLWRDGELVALIDWDTAEPAPPGWDLAQAGWAFIPLRPMTGYRAVDPTLSPEQVQHRMALWCREVGVSPRRLFELVEEVLRFDRDRLVELGVAGVEPYASFLARGDLEELEAERSWRQRNAQRLITAAEAELAG